jgi:hypothetical protein
MRYRLRTLLIATGLAMPPDRHTIIRVVGGAVFASALATYAWFLFLFFIDFSAFGIGLHPGFAIAYLLFGAFLVGVTFTAILGRRNGN